MSACLHRPKTPLFGPMRAGAMSFPGRNRQTVSVANVVNISELLNLNSQLSLDQVDALRAALVGHQAGDVRQAYTELMQKIDAGGATPHNYARAGVTAYLLSRHEQADRLLNESSGDGVACYFHAQVLQLIHLSQN